MDTKSKQQCYLASPHFPALHPPCTPNIRGIGTYLLEKMDDCEAIFCSTYTPLADATCVQIYVLSIKNSFSFISLECSHAKPSVGYTEQYSALTRREPAKHLGMPVGLKQVSLIITVLYGQNKAMSF